MQLFEQQIINLNFSFLNSSENNGVLLTNDYENINPNVASPEILFALETAKKKFNADAVYFRHFTDGRGNIPQLYLFDFTHKSITTEDKNRIHIKMWNGYQVPAYIIIEKSSVSIFDSRKRPKEESDDYAKELLTLSGQALRDFRAKDFDSGLFWDEQDEKKDFRFEESATRDLIRELKKVHQDFQKVSGLDKHVSLKLLVQSLLIKYLEERDEKSESGYFAGTYFKRHFQCSNFCDTIRAGKILELLDQLAEDFNGQIFGWDKKNEAENRKLIQRTNVKRLAEYLDGKSQDKQFVIWRLYSFSHLPVEVISSVYEELLTDSKDIVYTPEMIVSTLVDECMPLKQPKENFKIIDVSCGSGIFLVKTYKRIVQWWRYNEWKKTGTLTKPSLSVLKELLLKSIHGVDIQQDAIRLSVFSLALAVLDEVDLTPPIWEELEFPDLSNNIIETDFFKFITNNPKSDYDLVIGNPPFNFPKIDNIKSKNKYFNFLKNKYNYKSEIKIPNNHIALHFLVQSFKLLKKDATLCLIQPSGPSLYQKEPEFKKYVFEKHNLLEIIDFTKLADVLWGNRKISTAALLFTKTTPDSSDILHLVTNRNFSNTNKLFLEFTHYDFHFVKKFDAINKPYIWKSNLLGGGRIYDLIDRLNELPKLNDYIKDKKQNYKWESGGGFIVGNQKNKCDYITNKPWLEVKSLNENGISDIINSCDIQGFDNPRSQKIYEPPHLLIRGILGKRKIPLVFRGDYLTFPKGIYSIHAPENDREELLKLFEYLSKNMEVLRFYIISTSGRVLIDKSTALNYEDLKEIPINSNFNSLKISDPEKLIIDDINKYFSKFKILELYKKTTKEQILMYSQIFCKTLNSIYIKEKSFQLFKVIDAGKYYALHFEYTNENLTPKHEEITDLEQYIEEAIPTRNDNQQKAHIQRIIKAYGQDSIILAKPKQLRYWLPSIALRDADETFADYIKSRYQNA